MTREQIVIVILSVAAAALAVALIAVAARLARMKKQGRDYADSVRVIDGVRYSRDTAVTRDGEVNVSYQKGDFILEQGKTYMAVRKGKLMPGTYTLLASGDPTQTFKLRAGGYVRDYKHGDTLVLAEGDSVCAVSCNVILR